MSNKIRSATNFYLILVTCNRWWILFSSWLIETATQAKVDNLITWNKNDYVSIEFAIPNLSQIHFCISEITYFKSGFLLHNNPFNLCVCVCCEFTKVILLLKKRGIKYVLKLSGIQIHLLHFHMTNCKKIYIQYCIHIGQSIPCIFNFNYFQEHKTI